MQIIKEEIVPLSSKQNLILFIIIACLFQFVLFYAPALADDAVKQSQLPTNSQGLTPDDQDNAIITDSMTKNEGMEQPATKTVSAEAISAPKVVRTSTHTITAYNSEVAQTDDDPCTTANGFNLCQHGEEDSIAANFLKFGTKVKIPELFGDRVFVVRDRMNSRYTSRVDVWMKDHSQAVTFGVKVATIQVLE